MTPKPGLVVLCTGNSCRSQMAEAFFRLAVGDRYAVYSAGTRPAEGIHPLARQVMEEVGCDLAGQEPKHVDELLGQVPIETLVIVCDGAARECPALWPGSQHRLLWPFEDPAAFVGGAADTVAKFREVRDAIAAKVEAWAAAEVEAAVAGGRP